MPDKLTDSEIVKALECCTEDIPNCDKCPYDHYCDIHSQEHNVLKDTLDLINRLQAENERLQSRNNFLEIEYKNQGNLFWARIDGAKAEAYKEFAERLKEDIFNTEFHLDKYYRRSIDNLLKELVGK